jgi:hypothetical protein
MTGSMLVGNMWGIEIYWTSAIRRLPRSTRTIYSPVPRQSWSMTLRPAHALLPPLPMPRRVAHYAHYILGGNTLILERNSTCGPFTDGDIFLQTFSSRWRRCCNSIRMWWKDGPGRTCSYNRNGRGSLDGGGVRSVTNNQSRSRCE